MYADKFAEPSCFFNIMVSSLLTKRKPLLRRGYKIRWIKILNDDLISIIKYVSTLSHTIYYNYIIYFT